MRTHTSGHGRFSFMLMLVSVIALAAQTSAQQTATTASPQSRQPVFVAMYERGPVWDVTKGALQQAGITEHMQFLRANGERLVGAAPFQSGLVAGGPDRMVGMVIVTAATQDEAEKLIAGDPAITGKLMTATVRRWHVDRVRSY